APAGGINAVLAGGLWAAAPPLRVPRFRSFLATSLHRTTLCIDLVARCKRQRTRGGINAVLAGDLWAGASVSLVPRDLVTPHYVVH
ncbi:hypothetical protein ACUN7Z_19785, partial [Vreelandella venusta]|uniref:hypothetical protein n=1 Tax=Vreelandella venusta TaxID=44935 RepID=UPI0040447919